MSSLHPSSVRISSLVIMVIFGVPMIIPPQVFFFVTGLLDGRSEASQHQPSLGAIMGATIAVHSAHTH